MGLPLQPYEGKKRRRLAVFDVIIIILVAVIILQIYFSFKYTRVYVIGDSMLPTLTGAAYEGQSGGDYVLICDGEPTYGDIVVVKRQTGNTSKVLIKRVIALGGDTLYLDRGALYIKYCGEDDFVLVEEDYLEDWRNSPTDGDNTYPKNGGVLDKNGHTVADGCMFLMGDNRNVSNDSRSSDYGDFYLNELVGIVSDWSINNKSFLTGWFTFWDFTLPSLFS